MVPRPATHAATTAPVANVLYMATIVWTQRGGDCSRLNSLLSGRSAAGRERRGGNAGHGMIGCLPLRLFEGAKGPDRE
jgi:hypothetical protein